MSIAEPISGVFPKNFTNAGTFRSKRNCLRWLSRTQTMDVVEKRSYVYSIVVPGLWKKRVYF